ncbi:hypothetical protein Tco_0638330 [Tanacetum coccineum]
MDFGPIPFRVFYSWLDIDGFHDVVVQSYNEFDGDQEAACNYLKNKMKYFKGKIKDWHKDFKVAQTTRSKSLYSKIGAIENKMDDMTASEEEHDIYNMVTTFCNEGKLPIGCNALFITLIPKVTNPVFVKDYRPISLIGFQYKIIAKMLAMRLSRVIKWSDHLPILLHSKRMDFGPIPFRVFHSWLDIDGFHDVVVQSYNEFDGDQEAACNYLKNKMKYFKGKIKDWHKDFKVAQTTRSKSLCSKIGAIENKMDDMTASEEEHDIYNMVTAFCNEDKLPIGCNASFITLILKVANPVFVKDYRLISLIGFQYKIIAKMLAIRLSRVINKLISGEQSALSILINGSPTEEISMFRGLRQEDPLSSFIFILAMEGLYTSIQNVVEYNKIAGTVMGDTKTQHLSSFLCGIADDVVFLTDWSHGEVDGIDLDVLHNFHMASGLKINISKSNIYGVGVNMDEVSNMASAAGCATGTTPFIYLGIPEGASMARTSRWDGVIQRFRNRLSKWKVKMLSSGGRLTLIKSILGSLGIYLMSMFRVPKGVIKELEQLRARVFWGYQSYEKKIAWVAWDKVLASKDRWGLGIGSLTSFNLALLQKWRWRFYNESEAIWCRVIKAIHGDQGGVVSRNERIRSGTWSHIVVSITKGGFG